MFSQLFLEHPRSVGETYGEHCRTAFSFAGGLALAALCCAIHGLVPRFFEYRASRAVADLHEKMVTRRVRAREAAPVDASRSTV